VDGHGYNVTPIVDLGDLEETADGKRRSNVGDPYSIAKKPTLE
jgi:hypothetical protein